MNDHAPRLIVLWSGAPPSDVIETEFQRRGLELRIVSNANEVRAHLPLSRALVFCVPTLNQQGVTAILLACAESVVVHGLDLWILPEDEAVGKKVQEEMYTAFKRFFSGREVSLQFRLAPHFEELKAAPHLIPEACARYRPGPRPKADLKLSPKPTVITRKYGPTLAELLRRSFNDCVQIELEELSGGYSAKVFKVHASFEQRRLVNRPLPFYAKYDLLFKINQELQNYEDLVEAAVPFNLRPNLDPSRCIRRGYTHGLIVGNFVEYSEPLWEAARRGHGAGPIYSLFDQAFKSWRLNSQRETHQSIFQDLDAANIRIEVDRIDERRIEHVKALGAKTTPNELLSVLKRLPALPHRKGVIHGDLHVGNVRARGNDAVLIDFYSVNSGAPLAFDPATLEVSLAFAKYENGDVDSDWKDTIARLYDPSTFLKPPEPALQQHKREWLWNCVRQLRTIALSREEPDGTREYQTAITFVLLRRMIYPSDKRYPESRFAVGYLIAESLLLNLASEAGI
ncbi:MAG: phosphotransferase [Acidobacteriia bacterium]|nr:phosphotransferase [Terriglobia bacterium]